MSTPRIPMTTPTVIQQKISAGSAFNGTLPVADCTVDASNAMYKYPAATAGGLFLWTTREPIVCAQLLIELGGNGNVTVDLVNINPATIDDASPTVLSGEVFTLKALTGVPRLSLTEAEFALVVLPFQALRVTTTATAAAQVAQLTAYMYRPRGW